jgi:hypothetical protein
VGRDANRNDRISRRLRMRRWRRTGPVGHAPAILPIRDLPRR